jgi:hypothetical protein
MERSEIRGGACRIDRSPRITRCALHPGYGAGVARSIRFSFQIARETQTTLRTRFDWVPGHLSSFLSLPPNEGGRSAYKRPHALRGHGLPALARCRVGILARDARAPCEVRCAYRRSGAAFSGRGHASWRDRARWLLTTALTSFTASSSRTGRSAGRVVPLGLPRVGYKPDPRAPLSRFRFRNVSRRRPLSNRNDAIIHVGYGVSITFISHWREKFLPGLDRLLPPPPCVRELAAGAARRCTNADGEHPRSTLSIRPRSAMSRPAAPDCDHRARRHADRGGSGPSRRRTGHVSPAGPRSSARAGYGVPMQRQQMHRRRLCVPAGAAR